MKCHHRTLIALAGLVWLIVGLFLLTLGIKLILHPLQNPSLFANELRFSIVSSFSNIFQQKENSVIAIFTLALLIGYLKGKMILGKSVKRQVARIYSLQNPAPLSALYSKGYYFLIAGMMGLGMLMRILPISPDTRGAIDVAIGAALINGAILYFRHATSQYLPKKN